MSIATDYGFLWETLWNHPDNAGLKQLRKNPNVLFPGDVVVIPDKTERTETAPTEKLSKYVKRTNRAQVRLRLLDFKRNPRRNVQYTANVDGAFSAGKSDGDGYITVIIPPKAQQLRLKVSEGSKSDEYALPLGYIDPIEELSGVQQRLVNLGYHCASEQGTLGELTKSAIRSYQKEMSLTITGEPDDATREALRQIHGS